MRDQGLDLGNSGLVALPQPVLVDPPVVIVESLKYTGKVWTWANGPGIIFAASKTDLRHYKVIAAHDDVDNWKRISGKLPRWCFVYLNGQYFIGYPMVLWQGKEYYFGERPTETVLDYAPYPHQTTRHSIFCQPSSHGLRG